MILSSRNAFSIMTKTALYVDGLIQESGPIKQKTSVKDKLTFKFRFRLHQENTGDFPFQMLKF